MPQQRPMTFDEFRRFVSDILGIAESALAADAHFIHDLAIDSLKVVELVVQLETILRQHISSDAAWEILTMNDAYQYYLRLAKTQDDR